MPLDPVVNAFYENAVRVLTVTTSVDTTGKTVEVHAIPPSGNPIKIGEGTGAASNTPFNITCDWGTTGITNGVSYRLTLVYDTGATAKTLFPDDDEQEELDYIRENPVYA